MVLGEGEAGRLGQRLRRHAAPELDEVDEMRRRTSALSGAGRTIRETMNDQRMRRTGE